MTARRHDPSAESAIREAAPPSKRPPWPSRLPVNGPLFDARFRRHVAHLCQLGVRPVAECLLQLAGTGDDARVGLIVLLEQYQRLDAGVVKALGGDRWPETIFPVETA